MNRGRHRKKKIIQKITVEDLINCINLMKNDGTFLNFKSNPQNQFNPYFLLSLTDEQRKT